MIPDVYKKNVFTNMIHFIYSANAKRDMGKKENEISNNHNVFVLSHKKLCLHLSLIHISEPTRPY